MSLLFAVCLIEALTSSTFWTALGTLTALVLGVYPHWAARVKAPKLDLDFGSLAEASGPTRITLKAGGSRSRILPAFYFRMAVTNDPHLNDANKAEVWIEHLWQIQKDGNTRPAEYLPLRLQWTHTEAFESGSIASGSRRLLDVGYISKFHPELVFASEHPVRLRSGRYKITFLLTCPGSRSRRAHLFFDLSIPDEFSELATVDDYLKLTIV